MRGSQKRNRKSNFLNLDKNKNYLITKTTNTRQTKQTTRIRENRTNRNITTTIRHKYRSQLDNIKRCNRLKKTITNRTSTKPRRNSNRLRRIRIPI